MDCSSTKNTQNGTKTKRLEKRNENGTIYLKALTILKSGNVPSRMIMGRFKKMQKKIFLKPLLLVH